MSDEAVVSEVSASVEGSNESVDNTGGIESTEASAEQQPEVDQEDVFASRFAALTKKEKKLVQERAKIKEYESKLKEYESIKEGGVAKALESFGFTIDDVINYALGSDSESVKEPVDPNQQLREEFEAYKKSIEDKEAEKIKARQEAEEKQIQQAITTHKDSIAEYVSQNADTYELISSQGQEDLIWEVTEAHFNETGEILSIENAANMVENHLEKEVEKLLKLKKFNKQPVNEEKVEDKPSSIQSSYSSKTLTNSQVPTSKITYEAPKDREDSLKKAAELLKWN